MRERFSRNLVPGKRSVLRSTNITSKTESHPCAHTNSHWIHPTARKKQRMMSPNENENENDECSLMSESASSGSDLETDLIVMPPSRHSVHHAMAINTTAPVDGVPLRRGLQLNGMRFALTFPRCATSKEIVLSRLLAWSARIHNPFKYLVIAQEKHQQGPVPHLHVAMAMTRRIHLRKPNVFDFAAGKHGNYQGMRSEKKWITYCLKEDKEAVVHGTLPSFGSQNSKGLFFFFFFLI